MYTVTEPDQSLQITQMICMTVHQGNIGTTLTVVTEFTDGTAQSEYRYHHNKDLL